METIELYTLQEAVEQFYENKYGNTPEATTDQIMLDFIKTYDKAGFRLVLISAPEQEVITPEQPRQLPELQPPPKPQTFTEKIKQAMQQPEEEKPKKKKGLFGRR